LKKKKEEDNHIKNRKERVGAGVVDWARLENE
jgi:hypothetical protein